MSTAEQVRRMQMAAHWRLREQQEAMMREFWVPVVRLWADKLREIYPELFANQQFTSEGK